MISLRGKPGRIVRFFAQALVVGVVLVSLPRDADAYVPRGPLDVTKTAFGELTSHNGTDPQPYAFTGEPLDLNSGFQYHRARWMDPRTGRFAGMDPFEGLQQEPASLHKYVYAQNRPVILVDATGLFPSVPTLISFSVATAIVGIGLNLSSVANALFRQVSRDPEVQVKTDPIIIEGSGWNPTAAQRVMEGAQGIWLRGASIRITFGTPRLVKDPGDHLGRPLLDLLGDPNPDAMPEGWGPHVTIFLRSIVAENRDIDGYATGRWPTSRRKAVFIPFGEGRVTLAHEWGHSLNVEHGEANFTGGVMKGFFGATPFVNLREREEARKGVVEWPQ